MAEAVAGAISYIASGTYVYGAAAYMGYAYAIVLAAPATHADHMHKRAARAQGRAAA